MTSACLHACTGRNQSQLPWYLATRPVEYFQALNLCAPHFSCACMLIRPQSDAWKIVHNLRPWLHVSCKDHTINRRRCAPLRYKRGLQWHGLTSSLQYLQNHSRVTLQYWGDSILSKFRSLARRIWRFSHPFKGILRGAISLRFSYPFP